MKEILTLINGTKIRLIYDIYKMYYVVSPNKNLRFIIFTKVITFVKIINYTASHL